MIPPTAIRVAIEVVGGPHVKRVEIADAAQAHEVNGCLARAVADAVRGIVGYDGEVLKVLNDAIGEAAKLPGCVEDGDGFTIEVRRKAKAPATADVT
jgi:hypothetical protein